MNSLTKRYRPAALVIGSLLVIAVVALRGHLLLGAFWSNSGFIYYNHLLTQDVSTPSLYQRATAVLENATRYDPHSPSTWRVLGYISFLLGDQEAAVAAWKNTPPIVGEILDQGQAAQLAGDLDQALSWFTLVTEIAPGLADGWFFLGLTQETRGEWPLAVEAYEGAVKAANRERVGQSDPYFRLGRARWEAEGSSAQEVVLAELQRALDAGDFSGEWAEAETHYVRGLALRQTGRQREAAAEFERVLEHRPDDYWSRVQLGLLAWELDQEAAMAERWLQAAIELLPDNKWAYRHLGMIYEATGEPEQAAAMYEAVLVIDPNDTAATAFFASSAEQD